MTILDGFELTDSKPAKRGFQVWRCGCGWLWFFADNRPYGRTQHFEFFRDFAPIFRANASGVSTTPATATFRHPIEGSV